MVARSHVYKVLINNDGSVLAGATVTVNQDGGTTPTAQTLYANETGATTLANPFTASTGLVEYWVNTPERQSVVITPPVGGSPYTVVLDALPPAPSSVNQTGGGGTALTTDNPVEITNTPTAGKVLTATSSTQATWQVPPQDLTVTVQTASYTLVLADAYSVIEVNDASASVITVPTNASVAFDVGTVIEIFQYGAGQVTITPAGGVTIRALGGAQKTSAQYASCALRKRATNEWVLVGSLTT